MKEFTGTTHADPETVRKYAEGVGSFDDIAEDRGPREATTFDLLFDAGAFRSRVREMNEVPVGLLGDIAALVDSGEASLIW